MSGFNPAFHPRDAIGQFRVAVNTDPATALSLQEDSAPAPISHWIRTSGGIHRVQASTAAAATQMVAAAYPDEEVLGEATPELHVQVRTGDVQVTYLFDGDGAYGEYDPHDPEDTPMIRAVLAVRRDDEYVEVASVLTGTPSIADHDRVSSQAVTRSAAFAARQYGDDAEVADALVEWSIAHGGVWDPFIAPPQTVDEFKRAYPERDDHGLVIGYQLISASTHKPVGQPFPSLADAISACDRRNRWLRLVDVTAAPIRTEAGDVIFDL